MSFTQIHRFLSTPSRARNIYVPQKQRHKSKMSSLRNNEQNSDCESQRKGPFATYEHIRARFFSYEKVRAPPIVFSDIDEFTFSNIYSDSYLIENFAVTAEDMAVSKTIVQSFNDKLPMHIRYFKEYVGVPTNSVIDLAYTEEHMRDYNREEDWYESDTEDYEEEFLFNHINSRGGIVCLPRISNQACIMNGEELVKLACYIGPGGKPVHQNNHYHIDSLRNRTVSTTDTYEPLNIKAIDRMNEMELSRASVDEPFELRPLTEHALRLVTRGHYYACMDGKRELTKLEKKRRDEIVEAWRLKKLCEKNELEQQHRCECEIQIKKNFIRESFLMTERPEREKSDYFIEFACSFFSYIENKYLATMPYLDEEGDLFVDASESVDFKLIPESARQALDDLLQDLNDAKLEQAHVKGNSKLELHRRCARTYSTRIARASGDEIPAVGPVGRYKTYIDFDRMDTVALFVGDSYAQELDFELESVRHKLEQLHKEEDDIKLSLWLKSHKRQRILK